MTDPITCTWDEAATLDAAETILIAGWSHALRHGQTPRFVAALIVAALIVAAVDFDPRLGLHMDACTRHGCNVLVDEDARDEHGRLFCSQGCSDWHSETVEANMRHAMLVDGRYDVKSGASW